MLQNGVTQIAVLDTSAACHMPDVLEMPYRPPLYGAKEPGELPCAVRLGGPTCLAGDVIGEYSFAAPLREGDLPLPGIFVLRDGKRLQCLKKFEYTDFRQRLGRQDSRSRHIRTRS